MLTFRYLRKNFRQNSAILCVNYLDGASTFVTISEINIYFVLVAKGNLPDSPPPCDPRMELWFLK